MDNEFQPCFCLTELANSKRLIKNVAGELPKQYAKYCKYRGTGSTTEQNALADLHKSAKSLWNEFPTVLQSLSEMGEDNLLSIAQRMSAAVKSFDYLRCGDYDGLCGTLNTFTDMLPAEDGNINAGAAAHLMNRIKLGYFPTDPDHVRMLKSAVCFPGAQVNLFDPCCGEGTALRIFAEDKNAVTYGTELDEIRGSEAKKKLDRVGLGSFFASRISYSCFHGMFLNPPYLSAPGPNGNRRMEKAFLGEALPHLMVDGLLVYIIPFHRATESVCKLLAENFTNIRVYRFLDSEYKKFKQIAFIGYRTERTANPTATQELLNYVLEPERIPPITEIVPESYSLPSAEKKVQLFKGAVFDIAELAEQLGKSASTQSLFEKSAFKCGTRQPLLPLNLSQIGLVGASGLMNGLVDCEYPHIIKGRIVKEKKMSPQINTKNGDTEIREVTSNRMIFNILTPDGMISVS